MTESDDEKSKSKKSKTVWYILIFITVIIAFLSLWYYSGMVATETGNEICGCVGSAWNDTFGQLC